MSNSLRDKIMFSLTFTIVVMFIIFSLITYNQAKLLSQDFLLNSAQNTALLNAQTLNLWLQKIGEELTALSYTPDIRSMVWRNQLDTLNAVLLSHEGVMNMFVADANGKTTFNTGLVTDMSESRSFQDAMAGRTTYSDVLMGQTLESSGLMVTMPIYDEDESQVIGVLGYTMNLLYVQNMVKKMTIDGHG